MEFMKTIVKFELSNLQYPFVSFQIKHFEVSGSICLKKGLLGMEFNKKKMLNSGSAPRNTSLGEFHSKQSTLGF